jgi:spermidine synthase
MRLKMLDVLAGNGGNANSSRRMRLETPLVLLGFACSGAAALIYEVTWTRALSLVLGSTMYALSTMLSTFMAGLALGAFLWGRCCDRQHNLLFLFGLCELGIGISGLLSVPLIYKLPALYLWIYNHFHLYPSLFFIFQIALCVLVMLVPTLLMGATFPLVTKRITASMDEMGNMVSKAYSLNTMGAVVGSLLAGFALIPLIGLKGAAAVAAGLNVAVALGMMLLSGRSVLRPVLIALPIIVLSTAFAETSEHNSFLLNFHTASRGNIHEKREEAGKPLFKQVFHRESVEGQVRAFKTAQGMLLLQVGGKLEGTGMTDLPNTLLVALLPIASHPMPTNFLNIGLGAGVTLGAARALIDNVDLVEINPAVIDAVRRHGLPGLLDGVEIIRNDARNYLLRASKHYDVISSEPSYPTESGVANLFTREYFELASSRLTKHGVYGQWLPSQMLHDEGIAMMAKTFGTVFPNAYVWKVVDTGDVILVGSKEPFMYTAEEIEARLREMNTLGHPLSVRVLKSSADIAALVADDDVPMNTDDRPVLEFMVVDNMMNECQYCGEGHPSTSLLHRLLHR